MFRLRVLGGMSLALPAGTASQAMLQKSRLALLAALAVSDERGISRDSLLALFWPESDTARARSSLKQAMYAIRSELGAPDLIIGAEMLRLNPARIGSDVGDFNAAIRGQDLERAVGLYDGHFLEGVHVANGEFSRWQAEVAEGMAERYRGAITVLARAADGRADHADAIRWWRMLAAAQPLSALVTLSLMAALARSGDRTAAIECAGRHAQHVRRELETAPDRTVTAHAERLRLETETSPTREHESPKSVEATPPPLRLVEREPTSASPVSAMATGAVSHSLGARRRAPRQWLLAAATVLLLSTSILWALSSAAPGSLDPSHVWITTLVEQTPSDSSFVNRLAMLLRLRDPSLTVSQRATGRARYAATVSVWTEADATRFAVAVTDLSSGTVLVTLETAEARTDAPDAGLHRIGERLGVFLASQRDPEFAGWSHAASMPSTWAAFRELKAGIESWGESRLRSDPGEHLDSAAALDRNAATPLVWKAMVLSKQRLFGRSDSVLTALAASGRRLGPWDRALVDVLKSWNHGDIAGAHAVGRRKLRGIVPDTDWEILVAYDAIALGRADEALQIMRRVVPRSAWARRWGQIVLIQALHFSGDYAAELAVAQSELRADPDSRWGRQIAVRALAGLGRTNEVERMCTSSIPLGEARPVLGNQPCGQAIVELWGHGHPTEARALAKWYSVAVMAVDSGSPLTKRFALADLLQSVGDWRGAVRALEGISESDQENFEFLRMRLLSDAAAGNRGAVERTRLRLAALQPSGAGSAAESSLLEAEVAALLGDEVALAWIAKTFREGYRIRTLLHTFPSLERLRGHPRYAELLRPVLGSASREGVANAR